MRKLSMAIWTTPPINYEGNTTSIGEINYGVESRMFVFAYPSTSLTSQITDLSVAAYHNIVDLTPEELALYQGDKYLIAASNSQTLPGTYDTPIKYYKENVLVDTGLKISSNGQIVGRLKITDAQKELIIKVQYRDAPLYVNNTKYRTYACMQFNKNTYRLKKDVPAPFRSTTAMPDPQFWDMIGQFTPQFDTVLPYTTSKDYASLSLAHYGTGVYQLQDTIRIKHRALTDIPDENYWTNKGIYDANMYSPPEYTVGTTYVYGDYVQINGLVYIMYGTEYTAVEFNDVDWGYVGEAQSIPAYIKGALYDINAVVVYNGNLYKLTYCLPYISSTTEPDAAFWEYMTEYMTIPTSTSTRLFKIMINTRKSSLIEFETDSNLGTLKIGTQLGELVHKNIQLSNTNLISSFEVQNECVLKPQQVPELQGSYYPYLPHGLTISSDGLICGSCLGPVGTYKFNVLARNSLGLEKMKEFALTITEGYNPSTCRIQLKCSHEFERLWHNAISSSAFNGINYYRGSDSNYGLKSLPIIDLKRNYACEFDGTALTAHETAIFLKESLDFNSIQCRTGNIRYKVALDQNSKPLYEIVYKELFNLSHRVQYSPVPTNIPTSYMNDCITLKNSITNFIGSDDSSIVEALRYTVVGNTYDDSPLYQTNVDRSIINNSGAVDLTSYVPILPIAFVLPGEGKKLVGRIIDDGVVQASFYDILMNIDHLLVTPLGNFSDKVQSITFRKNS